MLNFINLDNKISIDPCNTFVITDLIHKNYQQQLAQAYPTQHFKEFCLQQGNEGVASDFQFKFEFFNIPKTDELTLKNMGFNPIWIRFIHLLLSLEYRESLGKSIGMNLAGTTPLIEFSRYRPGDWLDAHYDKQANKVLTQIFYFNTYWDARWGGYFHVVHPQDRAQTLLALPPLINYSVVVKPDPSAWHKVECVSVDSSQSRLNLVLEFYSFNSGRL